MTRVRLWSEEFELEEIDDGRYKAVKVRPGL
jgi:hypothetical protein